MEFTKNNVGVNGYLMAFTLAALTCTLIQFNVPLLNRDWILLLISAFFLAFNGAVSRKMKGFCWFCVYSVILFFNYVVGDNYFSSLPRVICEIAILYVVISFFDLAYSRNQKIQSLLLITFVVVLIITAIGTYIAEIMFPGVLRMVQSEIIDGGDSTTLYTFSKMGMTNYALPHALPALIPINILIIKEIKFPKNIRIVNTIALIATLTIIFYSGATTPVLLAIVAILLPLFTKVSDIKNNTSRLFLLVFVSLLLLVTKEYLAHFFLYISEQISSKGGSFSLVERFYELHNLILTGDTGEDMGERMKHYNATTSILKANIILGINDDSYGGHSALLDRIAVLGLVGFVPFLCFLATQVKSFYKRLVSAYRTNYLECLFIAFITILTKNMFSKEFCIITFFIIPLCLVYLQKNRIDLKDA